MILLVKDSEDVVGLWTEKDDQFEQVTIGGKSGFDTLSEAVEHLTECGFAVKTIEHDERYYEVVEMTELVELTRSEVRYLVDLLSGLLDDDPKIVALINKLVGVS